MDAESSARDCRTQGLFEVHALYCGGVHRCFEYPIAPFALSFRAIHRRVGIAEQSHCVDVGAVRERNPDARSDRDSAIPEIDGAGQRIEDSLRDAACLIGCIQVVHQDCELVSAEPGDRVDVAQG